MRVHCALDGGKIIHNSHMIETQSALWLAWWYLAGKR